MNTQETPAAEAVIDGSADAWHWVVTYDDGAVFAQYDADGAEHGWGEVELGRVIAVALIPQRPGLAPVSIPVEPGMKPVFKRVGGAVLHQGAEATPVRLHVLGWDTPGGLVRARLYLCEDGAQLLADRDFF